jgi:hypothetical protein
MRPWLYCLTVFAVLSLSTPILAQSEDDDAAQDPNYTAILNKLSTMKTSLDFTDADLQDVIDFVQQLTGINFVIDRRVFEEMTPEQLKITISLKELPLRTALRLILHHRGLTAEYRDGAMLIMPKKAVEEEVFLRLYDVRDLLFKIKDFPGPEIMLGGGDDSTVSAAFEEETVEKFEDPNFIVDLVKQNTGGDTWDRIEGCSVSLAANGMLLVVQNRDTHKEIDRLINLLRLYK